MATNLASIQALLTPGLMALPGAYTEIKSQWTGVYEKGTSELAVERSTSMVLTPLPQIKYEGQPTPSANGMGAKDTYLQEHVEIGLMYTFTRKALDDNLYSTHFDPYNLGLIESFNQGKEILGANLLNTANVYSNTILGDGVSLVNSTHPIFGGTAVSNTTSTAVDLNETTLYNMEIIVRSMTDNNGILKFFRPRKLIVPKQLKYVADRLFKTEYRPGTSDNDVNVLRSTGMYAEGYEVLDFLTSPYAWFTLTNSKGLNYLQRTPFETTMWTDDATDNLNVKGYERYSFGYNDFRAIAGTFPLI
jgi:hypothetical protein